MTNGGMHNIVMKDNITFLVLEERRENIPVFLPPSVRREVKGLSELLLLRHSSDILVFGRYFKVNKAQVLTF